jgi:hypothetical protein
MLNSREGYSRMTARCEGVHRRSVHDCGRSPPRYRYSRDSGVCTFSPGVTLLGPASTVVEQHRRNLHPASLLPRQVQGWLLFVRHRAVFVKLVLAVGLTHGCGGRTEPERSTGGPPGCAVPNSFADSECQGSRFYLFCVREDGSSVSCLSDSPTECQDSEASLGAECTSVCRNSEYAVQCPIRGPVAGPILSAPACNQFPPSPGGFEWLCCACQ